MGPAIHDFTMKYSNERIWRRQSVEIEKRFGPFPKLKRQAYGLLKKELGGLEGTSLKKRCEFDTHFGTSLKTGSVKEAEKKISESSYEPYAECKISSQVESVTKWYSLVGAAMFLTGAIPLLIGIGSFVGRGVTGFLRGVETALVATCSLVGRGVAGFLKAAKTVLVATGSLIKRTFRRKKPGMDEQN